MSDFRTIVNNAVRGRGNRNGGVNAPRQEWQEESEGASSPAIFGHGTASVMAVSRYNHRRRGGIKHERGAEGTRRQFPYG